jgi:hypothetical protein
MNDKPNPFKPPGAPVVDGGAGAGAGLSGAGRIALAVATSVQPILFFGGRPGRVCFTLVDAGVMSPIGAVSLMAGFACLYIGVIRLVMTRRLGARFLAASVVLQLLAFRIWWTSLAGSWNDTFATFFAPYAFGIPVAVGAWLAARYHAPARPARAIDAESAP